MTIFFVGNPKIPFMRQDISLLQDEYDVFVFDTSDLNKWTFAGYLFDCLLSYKKLKSSEAIWIWSADYFVVPFILLGKIAGVQTVVNVGGWEVANVPEIEYGNQRNLIRGTITRWILRNCSRIVTPSESYKKIVESLIPFKITSCKGGIITEKSIVSVIPNFVDGEILTCELPEKERLVVTVSCAPEAERVKGIDVFEFVMNLPKNYDMKIIRQLNRSEYITMLKRAKVFCMLSKTEAFGVSLIEAMALGCIPVVTNADALPEITGGSGVVVDYGNIRQTYCAIQKAMVMDGAASRQQAKKYSRERKKKLVYELLESLKCH